MEKQLQYRELQRYSNSDLSKFERHLFVGFDPSTKYAQAFSYEHIGHNSIVGRSVSFNPSEFGFCTRRENPNVLIIKNIKLYADE